MSDAALMARYCAGDKEAFYLLYQRIAPRLFGYLVSLVDERPTAEDLLQLTFLKLHEARHIYIEGANPVPWLYTIAHRTFLDESRRRRHARVKLTIEGDLPEPPHAGLLHGSDEESDVVDAALARSTLDALEQLPHSQREALVLTKLQGRSQAEAAAIAGTTAAAIKLRSHRGYVALRRILGQGETA